MKRSFTVLDALYEGVGIADSMAILLVAGNGRLGRLVEGTVEDSHHVVPFK